ncbi:MAG: hypothetical protein OSJ70_05950 [Bacilli bacterium]|nr:hypothetical protein [Bacilli bacterium]
MKEYIKKNLGDMVIQYVFSIIIVLILGYFLKLDLLQLIIIETVIVFIDFFWKYRRYKKENSEKKS